MPRHAFTDISPYYDILMKGIAYREWINYTVDLFNLIGLKPKRVLDLACGTGSATLELVRRGFEVMAIDRSPQMLERLKAKKGSEKIEVMEGNMEGFQVPEPVDAVTCYFDSVNYLLEERTLKRCFASVYNALAPWGAFVFDMNTIYGLEKVWGTNTLIREYENVYSVWKSVYDFQRNISTLNLTLFVRNGQNYSRIDEVHQERAYPLTEVKKFLEVAGFSRTRIFGHMTTNNYLDISSRVMIIAEKRE